MEEKYVIFIAGSLVCIPVGIALSVNFRRIQDFVFAALVFGTTQPDNPFGLPASINLLSREWYRGSTRGIEISYLDLLAVILLVSALIVRQREEKRFYWPPSFWVMSAFAAWCGVTMFFAEPQLFGYFELTKILRGILLFVAVAMYVRSPREVRLFVWFLVATIFYQAAVCLEQRYIQGRHRIRGTTYHPNSLSMYSLQFLPIFVVTAFSSDITRKLRYAAMLGFVAACGCVLLSISRTGFAAMCILVFASFLLCTKTRLTPRNLAIAGAGIALVTLMVVRSWDTVMSRLGGFDMQHEYFSEEGDRGGYFRQGAPAIRDHPIFGIGLNNWSYWITNYYGPQVGNPGYTPYIDENTPPPPRGRQAAPAHNLFLITLVEVGWPGLLLLLMIFARWLQLGWGGIVTRSEGLLSRLQLGVALSVSGVLMQSWTEWEFRQTHMFFLGHIIIAVGAVLYAHRETGSAVRRVAVKRPAEVRGGPAPAGNRG